MLEKFDYLQGKKVKTILVKRVSVFSSGLMFRKNSPPLLFELRKPRKFSIFSFFCKPFVAIWLDKNKKVLRSIQINSWKWKIPGEGKYLLEIPISDGYNRNL
jgi:uncharacterized membrane protein (UPF0127 family)